MNITYQANGALTLGLKQVTQVSFGTEITLGNFVIPGAGEYDVNGVPCEVHPLNHSFLATVRLEDLTICYLPELAPEVKLAEEAVSAHILCLMTRSNDQPEMVKNLIKALEPSYVFLMGIDATREFAEKISSTIEQASTFKISRSSLPLEGTIICIPS